MWAAWGCTPQGLTSPVSVSTQECMPPADTCLIRSPGTQGVGSTTSLQAHAGVKVSVH